MGSEAFGLWKTCRSDLRNGLPLNDIHEDMISTQGALSYATVKRGEAKALKTTLLGM